MKKKQSITYSESGVKYSSLDPIKKLAQDSAKQTAKNLTSHGFSEIADSRGESAYVWKQDNYYMASVVEGLGTKNLVADAMEEINKKKYYDIIGHDTVAAIINDLVAIGAQPLVIHAYWASGNDAILKNKSKMQSLVKGWKNASDISGVSWGGGETPGLSGIIHENVLDLAGSAIGIIKSKKNLLLDTKLKAGDRILLLKSTGINANGLSLARAVAKKLPKGYATRMDNGELYGDAILQKTNIYAKLIQNLLALGIDIHYISNITGHGMRKIMRARENYTYIIDKIFTPPTLFPFIQKHAGLDDYEMYQTYNMGQDYALFIPEEDIKKTQAIVKKYKFESLDAGYIEKGERQVIIKPKNLVYKGDTLNLR